MKYLSLLSLLTTSAIALGTNPSYSEALGSSEKTFFCQADATTTTTLAKTIHGENVTIFNWDSEAFPTNTNLQELCENVSEKLDNYLTSENNLSLGNLSTTQMDNIPAICLSDAENSCDLVLFTLEPKTEAIAAANLVLDSILNPQLKQQKVTPNKRCIQPKTYSISLWTLLGLNFTQTQTP
ncbi:MAG: COP23 domain-containing protein [Cyanobacteria bacterium P01_F01_bin.143]